MTRKLSRAARVAEREPDRLAGYCGELAADVSLAMFCIDGMAWEVFAKEPHLLAVVESHVRQRGAFEITDCTLEESLSVGAEARKRR